MNSQSINRLTVLTLWLVCITQCHAGPGDVDLSFDPGSGANNSVYAVALQADGKVLIGGFFSTVNGTNRNRIARLNIDGSLDSNFNPGTGTDYEVQSIATQNDGKILIGGGFTTVNGTNRNCIARLNNDGSVDGNFNPGAGANGSVLTIAIQNDKRALIGGYFSTINGISRNRIARLNTNGALDDGFNPGPGANLHGVFSLALQDDGKVLIGGHFTTVNGTNRSCIARLNADGSLDNSFDPGSGANEAVLSVALQKDGKMIIGGNFTAINSTNCNRIARLYPDGSLDNSFSPGSGANSSVRTVALQADGKVLIGGDFTSVNGTNRSNIARLNTDGSLDNSFNPSTGAYAIYSIAEQRDGKAVVGGYFSFVNGINRKDIVRLFGDNPPRFISIKPLLTGGMELTGWAATNAHLQLDFSTNLSEWNSLFQFTNITGTFIYADNEAANSPHRFYRALWLP